MISSQALRDLAPAGYKVVLCDVHDDASAIVLQLDCNGNRICGSLVAGHWSFYVPQNTRGTAMITATQHSAIKTFADAVYSAVGQQWITKHTDLYSNV
jgi:hypothetical protein